MKLRKQNIDSDYELLIAEYDRLYRERKQIEIFIEVILLQSYRFMSMKSLIFTFVLMLYTWVAYDGRSPSDKPLSSSEYVH
jgi:hypothetical protein